MWNSVINTIGMCLIGGKYMLMFILATTMFFSGSFSTEMIMMQGVDPAE